MLDAAWLNQAGLGALKLAGAERVVVQQALRLAPGGEAVLYAPWVAIDADLSAPGGRIQAGNVLKQMSASNGRVEEGVANPAAGKPAGVRVGARVDAGGLWTNLALTPQDSALMAWRHGGSVALRSSGDVSLTQSGSINVSSGAGRSWAGVLRGGKGGDVTLAANALGNATGGVLTVAGEIAGYGWTAAASCCCRPNGSAWAMDARSSRRACRCWTKASSPAASRNTKWPACVAWRSSKAPACA